MKTLAHGVTDAAYTSGLRHEPGGKPLALSHMGEQPRQVLPRDLAVRPLITCRRLVHIRSEWIQTRPRRTGKDAVQMVQTVWLTEAGKRRLEDELQDLRTRRRPELHTRIQEATESGDISDNSEYEDLKDEWASLEARIFDLEQTLEHSEIIQRQDGDDVVGLGSTVTLRSDDGEEETWVLVSPQEANTLDGTISTESPVGRAIVGCRAGDAATVRTPSGAIVFTVVTVG